MSKKFKPTVKNIALLLLAVCIAAFVMVYTQNRLELGRMYDEAQKMHRDGHFQQAVDLFKKIAIKYENTSLSREALFKTAEIYHFNMMNHRLAINTLVELESDKDISSELLFKTRLLLAKIYSSETGDNEEALALLNKASKMNLEKEDEKTLQKVSAQICQNLGDHKKAIKHYSSALELAEDREESVEIKLHLVSEYTALFERKKAEKILRELLSIKELKPERKTRVAWLLFMNLDEQDKFREALKVINMMLSNDPDNETLLKERKRIREEIEFIRKTKNKLWWQ